VHACVIADNGEETDLQAYDFKFRHKND